MDDVWAEWDSNATLELSTVGRCWQCGYPTRWVEINFEAYLCSLTCNSMAWDKFSEASRLSDLKYKGEDSGVFWP